MPRAADRTLPTSSSALRDTWHEIRLGDACAKIGSGATPRGGSSVYVESAQTALIRSQNVYNEGFRKDGIAFITPDHAEELAQVEVMPGDVLLNITGDSVARSCQVDRSILPARVNQHVAIVRPDPAKIDARFLRYALISPPMQAMMLSWAGSGGTRNALTKEMVESFTITAPCDVAQQRTIAHILGTLDDKIELNRRMNDTLEAMARAIFKSWFVDSGPVASKAEEHDASLRPGLPQVMPSASEGSKSLALRRGWELRSLYDCATYTNGAVFRSEDFCDKRLGLPIIKIGELKSGLTGQTKYTSKNLGPRYRVKSGDILFSWSGSPDTSIDTFVWTNGDGWLNQHIFKVESDPPEARLYVYYLLRSLKSTFVEIARNKQTTGLGHVTTDDLKRLKTAFPSVEMLREFNRIVQPIHAKSFSNCIELQKLALIRDALLPQLISGAIPVVPSQPVEMANS
jgi:type I restriction enzyme, S subunit